MVARRLCVTTDEGRGDGPVAYLAHEALIRSWPRAQQWLERETLLLRMRDELARDATVWDFHQRTDDWLAVSPEKLAAIWRIEQAGLTLSGVASDYAQRSRRRAARNRLIRFVAIAGICALSVLASAAWLVAHEQRDIARAEAETADRTTRFMVSLFQLADPGENRGNAVTVKEVLDKGAQAIRDEQGAGDLRSEPRVRAELLTAMGQAYAGLGLYQPAETLLSQARSDDKSASVPPESRIRTLVASGSTAYLAGDYDAAADMLTRAVALAREHLAKSDPLRSQALAGLADVEVQLGKFAEAEALCREALAADRKRGAQGAAVLAQSLDSLGRAYFYSGDLAAAEAPLRESLALREQVLGARHSLTAISLGNLAGLLYQSGRYDEALSMYREALPIYREVYGPEHPEVASVVNDLGRTALMTGRIDEAEPLLRQALSMTEKSEGDTHDDLISPLNSLAMIDAYRGRLDAGRSEIQRAATIARMPNHDGMLDQVLLTEADLELAAGNRALAGSLLKEAQAQLQRLHPDQSADAWRYAVWNSVNAQRLAADGDQAGAAQALAAAQRILDQRFGANGFYSLLAKRRQQLIAKTP